ncbi:MAG: MoxR family ATPase, partial [Pseudomonadota bacterium]
DIIGNEILQPGEDGSRRFQFEPGPIFTQVLLTDEINRAPPKTQAALLEAMQEHAVTYAGETRALPEPFFVLATQNPLEQAGTYPLPEAELDRFLLMVRVPYPTEDEEIEVLRRTTGAPGAMPEPVMTAAEVMALQMRVREVVAEDIVVRAAATMVRRTRPDERATTQIRDFVRWGAGPRAGQSLVLAAKARALMSGRFAATRDDLAAIAHPVLRHRLILNYRAEAEGVGVDEIIDSVVADA